jgi:hypothetical protein
VTTLDEQEYIDVGDVVFEYCPAVGTSIPKPPTTTERSDRKRVLRCCSQFFSDRTYHRGPTSKPISQPPQASQIGIISPSSFLDDMPKT